MTIQDVRMEDAVDDPEGALHDVTVHITCKVMAWIDDRDEDFDTDAAVMDALRKDFGSELTAGFDDVEIVDIKEVK